MSMIDAYKIGVELVMGGNLAQGIEAMMPGLEALDAKITHANAEAMGLSTALASIGRQAFGISRTADAVERLSRATAAAHAAARDYHTVSLQVPAVPFMPGREPGGPSAPGGGHSGRGGALSTYVAPNFTMPGGPPGDEPFVGEGEGRIPLYPNGRGAAHQAAGERRGGSPHIASPVDDVFAGLIGGDFLLHIFGASFDVGAKESELLGNGWTPEQVSRARALAQQVQVSTPGVSIGSAREVVKDLGVLFRTRTVRRTLTRRCPPCRRMLAMLWCFRPAATATGLRTCSKPRRRAISRGN